jgi:hypothetical protein
VMSKYYTYIEMSRLSALLELPEDQVETFLSDLVVSKTVYAKIDRLVPNLPATFRFFTRFVSSFPPFPCRPLSRLLTACSLFRVGRLFTCVV